MRYSFTATRDATPEDAHTIQQRLMQLQAVTAIYTGGAPGGDQLIAELALTLFPDALHGLVLPAKRWVDMPFVERWKDRLYGEGYAIHWTEMHPLKRNSVLVDMGHDALEAFPLRRPEILRSGTWATVRYARRTGVPVTITPLRGG